MRAQHAAIHTLGTLVLMAALALGGGLADAQDAPPPRPELMLRTAADGVDYEGVLAEFCWPAAEGDVNCGASPEAPEDAVAVSEGDVVVVVATGEAGAPGQIELTFVDDLDDAGDPITVSLDEPGETTEWVVAGLTEGEHALVVDALYPDISGFAYVRYRFTLDVRVATPTEEPTEEPTEKPTERPTGEPTETASETPTEGANETPAAETAAETTGTVTLIPTAELTPEEAATEPSTPVATETPTTATAEPAAGAATAPPKVVLESAGVQYAPVAVSYCWENDAGERECPPDQPSDQGAERLVLPPINAVLIVIEELAPDSVDLILLAGDGVQELARESRPGDVLLLYSPPAPDLGSYVVAVQATWPQGIATYYFQIVIVPEPEPPTPSAQ